MLHIHFFLFAALPAQVPQNMNYLYGVFLSRLCTKQDETLNFTAVQNPSDTEATFRIKAGKVYCGYVANLEETVGKNGSVVMDYAY